MIEENHEAIVTRIDFDTVQSLLQRDVRVAPQEESVHLFSGYVHCGDYEHTMVRKVVPSRGKKYYYYVCSTYKAKLGCSSHSFSESKLNMLVSIPPKYSISSFMGYLKGKSALMIFDQHANLKYKYGNRHFWVEVYYVSTVGLNEATIRKYIQEQEKLDIAMDKLSVKEYENPFKG